MRICIHVQFTNATHLNETLKRAFNNIIAYITRACACMRACVVRALIRLTTTTPSSFNVHDVKTDVAVVVVAVVGYRVEHARTPQHMSLSPDVLAHMPIVDTLACVRRPTLTRIPFI